VVACALPNDGDAHVCKEGHRGGTHHRRCYVCRGIGGRWRRRCFPLIGRGGGGQKHIYTHSHVIFCH
jgi:hypothetical protein